LQIYKYKNKSQSLTEHCWWQLWLSGCQIQWQLRLGLPKLAVKNKNSANWKLANATIVKK